MKQITNNIMDNKDYCFVIQPIRAEKYDKRFDDIYAPAIVNAGLRPYRVDKDPSVRNIIDEIEKRIQKSMLCLADISIDNPNVWYELGYASAIGKDIVMVCDESRNDFPFDISHKSIISYKTESPRDFKILEEQITNKIKSYLKSDCASKKILESPLNNTDGFQPFEIAILALIIGEQSIDEQSVSIYTLKEQMSKAGFNEIATSIGIRLLQRKQFLKSFTDQDWNGNEFYACKLTEAGVDFILNNIELFNLQKQASKLPPLLSVDDNLPF